MKRVVGARPKGKVKISWSRGFAYALGLIASDGCLSPNGRHIVFVSKDRNLVELFKKSLHLTNRIGRMGTTAWRIQFGDVLFYRYLLSIGFMPNKSKKIGKVGVPSDLFFHFLRGVFDGDGSAYLYRDIRWKSSCVFYMSFASASDDHVQWIRKELQNRATISGHVSTSKNSSTFQLKYGKKESSVLIPFLYENSGPFFLPRKRLKIRKILAIVGGHSQMPRC
jgi:hypothetical protein